MSNEFSSEDGYSGIDEEYWPEIDERIREVLNEHEEKMRELLPEDGAKAKDTMRALEQEMTARIKAIIREVKERTGNENQS